MTVLNKKVAYDVTIMGNGIASKVLLYFILRRYPALKVQVIESPLYPACSIKTTSHVAVAQKVEGTGQLGELVVNSWLAFKKFVDEYSPSGVDRGLQYKNIFKDGIEHYFISPQLFFDWIDGHNFSQSVVRNVAHIENVSEKDGHVILDSRDESFYTKKLLIACGPGYSNLSISGASHDFDRGFVKRPGSYWIASAGNYSSSSPWVYTLGKANLVYRKSEKLFLLGGTTNSENELSIDFKTLIEWHSEYQKKLDFLPSFSEGQVDSGIRFRGPKRLPFCGKISGTQEVYALTGLHKNGFSYPFHLSDLCLKEMFGE